MADSVTFVPRGHAGAETGELTYVERISRNRSLHILLQDTRSDAPASRGRFLLGAYREIVSRYLALGRIEHPLPLLRDLILYFDALSRRVDCRVDDFRGLGFYVLLQDGNTYFLLSGRGGRVAVARGGGFEGLETGGVSGVQELPVSSTGSQKELFSNSMRDFLALYRIDSSPETGPVRVIMGGGGGEIEAVLAVVEGSGRESLGGTRELDGIGCRVMYCAFDLAEPGRMPPPRRDERRPAHRGVIVASAVGVAIVAAASVWITQNFIGERSAPETAVQGGAVSNAAQEAPPRLRPADEAEPVVVDAQSGEATDAPGGVSIELEWRQSRENAVTTTPLVAGTQVIYGSRDGYLYAVDRDTGEERWRYRASGGVGSSPVAAGRAVVAADYGGYVFSVDMDRGSLNWKRGLPARVVSTAAVGEVEVLVGCTDGIAYCLSLETGRVLWKLRTGDRIRGSAAWSDGIFFVPSYDSYLYAVSAGTGKVIWKHPVGNAVSSSPAVFNEVVVVGSENNAIYGVGVSTGERRWTFATVGPVKSFLRVEGDRVYAGCSGDFVYCLDAATGDEVWRYRTGGAILSRPFVTGGIVFVSSYDRNVYCLDAATGALRGRYATDGEVFSSPVADGDHVYFGNNTGRFYCVRYREEPAS